MKFTFFTLALLAFSLRLAAQTNLTPLSSDKLFYAQKVEKYKRMKTTGGLMIAAGTVLAIVGISNLSSVTYTTTTNQYGQQQTTSSDPAKSTAGALMFIGGAGLLGGGIPLTIVGSKNTKKYQRKLDALTFNLNLAPNQQGLTLCYRF